MLKITNNISPSVGVKLYSAATSELIYEANINMSQNEHSELSDCLIYTNRDQWESSPIVKKVLAYIMDMLDLPNLDAFEISLLFQTETINHSSDNVVIADDYYEEDMQPWI